ncbi:hypothetical protein GGI01_002358 [Coemansia sp. RSA 376]|nr:hypothetical protein LPJ71_004514 [Coemansia sp. S17]KAJ2016403.1 hypothetical protein GGI14_003654 [Coemansia sp. S680]KAJ2027164.1 hypothetical protein H4S03_008370 [Coemansia sp. S3946]KAJ2074775.1 hypothetical protein GGI09_008718 [Coemansia sp. S100]KAJ2075569.1 hypothetical protein GGI16_008537 [Coemansia sp. S142-1]KAJ2099651.1 hypothetical protein IW146_009728 [Coemansia sp. RSA 922]KAJ2245122.1 hypothetical protein GGI13_005961 [Coemansia sp. RSA 455]KAJ2261337.1 hypothetical pro
MKCIRVSDPASFDALVTGALKQSDAVYVLFFGREAPGTNKSWCSDCVIADPLVREEIGRVENSVLLEVPVDRSTDKDSATNTFRKRSDIKLTRIPTLLRWSKAGPAAIRLVEDECNRTEIRRYIAQTDENSGHATPLLESEEPVDD